MSIPSTNWITFVITLIACTILYLGKEFVNEPLKRRKFPIPVPFELLVVIIGTLASYFLNLNSAHKVKVVGYIPAG